jgi:DNA-binding response OmpR family regulator
LVAYDATRGYILLNMPPEVEVEDLSRSAFRVGEWLVQPSLNRVTRGDTTIQLELKVMDVLVCLAGWAGEVVRRRLRNSRCG